MPQLILGSSSPFRKAILDKLNLDYQTASPDIDETPYVDEEPSLYVARLAEAKARRLQSDFTNALIIGSDQAAVINGRIIGKPGDHASAVSQLREASGQIITFYTGLCLLNTETGHAQVETVPFYVHFRELTDTMIDNYLQLEQPYNCAGSFKSEGAGIALFERLEGDDPNTLIGMPLIRLIRMLEKEGVGVI